MGPLATPGAIAQRLLLMEAPAARRPIRAANVLTAGPVGIKILKTYHTANTKMHVFKHPKFYEEYRQRAKREQARKRAEDGGRVGPKATSSQANKPASAQASSGSRTNKR